MALTFSATKRSLRARAVHVQRSGDQLLAGAGLAVDPHGDRSSPDTSSKIWKTFSIAGDWPTISS
jgi:hypothetical protein